MKCVLFISLIDYKKGFRVFWLKVIEVIEVTMKKQFIDFFMFPDISKSIMEVLKQMSQAKGRYRMVVFCQLSIVELKM